MSPSTPVYRRQVFICVLPHELRGHLDELQDSYAETPEVQFVVERRGGDRRVAGAGAPDGVERRAEDRRVAGHTLTAAQAGIELPRALRQHAPYIKVIVRAIPVRFQDADREADALLAAAAADPAARDELRLRFHPEVIRGLRSRGVRRRALEVTDEVFDDLFAEPQDAQLHVAVSRATTRVLARR